ncbi:hypothetical protein NC652_035591 [Populus alba x Populus x berolinensis]|uniref:Uncharacterized protein n=1 Tax=Populus alba x Populus x berolinensis TaxID=444605 RepID=A0AAD6PXJ7_9ROSI|nr:hypothetical protein NC652_035591 [Populus alba x Populus x berolinensis]KAJ6971256.1 hypothetical protein NC653_035508 [Populus alba x Populus x berolinensis]
MPLCSHSHSGLCSSFSLCEKWCW